VTALSSAEEPIRRLRRPTTTARFGSSRRESHDASAFYERFVPPVVSSEANVVPPVERDTIHVHDARDMSAVASNSVALVVTSPPYFAGKEYEESLGENGVPGSYFEYLALLKGVFEECVRVLEPGGRIAVNVANLGRRPYRSLAGDVTGIFQDLGLLMRGEVVWWKGRAAGGSCAWGTFQRPSNPVLRDVTERIVIASKGRFDRALTPKQRLAEGLPSTATVSRDEFLEATTDLWEIPPESATRVGHPAPFPVDLPRRLIELYTYEGDLVLDPFMGSGSTALAALQTARHYVGFDNDPAYVEQASARIEAETGRLGKGTGSNSKVRLPAVPSAEEDGDLQARAVREGRLAKDLAKLVLEESGFVNIRSGVKPPGLGIELSHLATDRNGEDWAFDVSGAFTSNRSGLTRTDTLWKALGKAAVLSQANAELPLVLLTTDAPTKGSAGHTALSVVLGRGKPVFDVIEILDPIAQARLTGYAERGRGAG
jgi:site-specific DNA-methyltransferase (adenine-specific)